MSWLKRRAKEAAKWLGEECGNASHAKPDPVCDRAKAPVCDGCKERERIAKAAEAVAREFAERALRKSYKVHVFGITMDEAIPLSIAAAEQDE